MDFPVRKNTRLQGYDYTAPGAYFVTVCTQNRRNLFHFEKGNVGNGLCAVPIQNQIVHHWLKETENKFGVKIDKYAIMPNHIHCIVTITERHAGRSLHDIMRWFKTMTTNAYICEVKNGRLPPFYNKVWQKSFHDHIIRGEADYLENWQYIDNNPLKWEEDCFYTK